MSSGKRKIYWNIVKALGIISIVIGHSWARLVRFVYFYHLPLFFFVGGALYNEIKYGNDPYLNFSSKIKNNWLKYVQFIIFFTLIHNLLLENGLIINTNHYGVKEIAVSYVNSFIFKHKETLGGALWFVPTFILSSTLFGVIIYFSNKIFKLFKENKNVKHCFIVLATLFCGLTGFYFITRQVDLSYRLQICFLVIPFFTFGYYFKNYAENTKNKLNIFMFIVSFIFMLYVYFKTNLSVDLSFNKITNLYLFYPVSFAGIYFCLYLSGLISKIKYVNIFFDKIGNYSYEIMGLHFLVFKIIDFVYARANGIVNPKVYGVFPYAFGKLHLLYVLLGVLIPVVIFMLIDIIKKKIKKSLTLIN